MANTRVKELLEKIATETDADKLDILRFDLAEAMGQKDKDVKKRKRGGSEMTDKQKKFAALAEATAMATQQISQMAQQAAGTGQADPIVQLKQQELQIQQAEVQRKAMADQQKAQLEAAKLQQEAALKRAEISSDEDIAALRANVTMATRKK